MKTPSKLIRMISIISILTIAACTRAPSQSDSQQAGKSEPDINEVHGELINQTNNGLTIRQEDGTEIKLLLNTDTQFWDGIDWLQKDPALIGDQIEAYGTWSQDHTSFKVDNYYANRIILKGMVTYQCGEIEGYFVDQPGQDYLILPLKDKTKLLTAKPADPRSYLYYDLMPNYGETLEIVARKIESPFVLAVQVTRMN